VLDGELVTVEGKMNELETRRKAFQNIGSEQRVAGLFDISKQLLQGTLAFQTHGPVE
jgi:hypothetical protein